MIDIEDIKKEIVERLKSLNLQDDYYIWFIHLVRIVSNIDLYVVINDDIMPQN